MKRSRCLTFAPWTLVIAVCHISFSWIAGGSNPKNIHRYLRDNTTQLKVPGEMCCWLLRNTLRETCSCLNVVSFFVIKALLLKLEIVCKIQNCFCYDKFFFLYGIINAILVFTSHQSYLNVLFSTRSWCRNRLNGNTTTRPEASANGKRHVFEVAIIMWCSKPSLRSCQPFRLKDAWCFLWCCAHAWNGRVCTVLHLTSTATCIGSVLVSPAAIRVCFQRVHSPFSQSLSRNFVPWPCVPRNWRFVRFAGMSCAGSNTQLLTRRVCPRHVYSAWVLLTQPFIKRRNRVALSWDKFHTVRS